MSPRERSILTVTCFGHFMSHFNMLVFPAILLPLSGRLGLDVAQTLALSFWMYLLFGLTALPWGLLADRFGARPLLAVFYLGAGLFGFLAALNLSDPLALGFCLAGIGLFSGIYHPAGLGWIAKEFEKTSQGMAYNGMFGNLGLATAPLLAGSVNYLWGTEAVYMVLGVMNIGGFFLLYLARNGQSGLQVRTAEANSKHSFAPFLILLLAMTLGGIVYRGTSVTLPAYFELQNRDLYQQILVFSGQLGTPNLFATLVTSFIYLVGMVGQYTGGRVGESSDLGRGYLVFHLITIPAALAMSITTDTPLILFAMIHSFFSLACSRWKTLW